MKNGKIKKQVFIYFSIVIIVVFAALGLACSSRKVKAGVIVDATYTATNTPLTRSLSDVNYIGIYSGSGNIAAGYIRQNNTNVYQVQFNISTFDGSTAGTARTQVQYISYNQAPAIAAHYIAYSMQDINNYIYILIDFARIIQDVESVGYTAENLTFTLVTYTNVRYVDASYGIAAASNLYDLRQNDIALIFISDISGLGLSMHDEIIINWGYIDSTDNTIYSVHAPAVQAQVLNAQAQTIRLAVPINAAGDVLNYYDIDQRSILTSITTGGATATAHIYGLYVWLKENRIQWGLAEFDTSGTPASGASMNYITTMTSLYDYTAPNTSTMTCRLSISNNFNFITIKNQSSVDVASVNAVIRQGGFLPAWAVYNWARGSASGYVSGEQAGAAPYQPGNTGYQAIYDEGYRAGVEANVGTVNWFVSAFGAVDAFLSIHIFPNITFGALLGIPFVISVVWFIIRTFRGGGGGN